MTFQQSGGTSGGISKYRPSRYKLARPMGFHQPARLSFLDFATSLVAAHARNTGATGRNVL